MKRICALIATVAVGMLGVVACGDDDEEAKTETVTTEEKQATGAPQDCPAGQIWAIALKKCVDVDTRAHPPEHVHGGGTASAGDGGCPAGYTAVIATGGCAKD